MNKREARAVARALAILDKARESVCERRILLEERVQRMEDKQFLKDTRRTTVESERRYIESLRKTQDALDTADAEEVALNEACNCLFNITPQAL